MKRIAKVERWLMKISAMRNVQVAETAAVLIVL